MPNDCLPQLFACRLRVTRLLTTGHPDVGSGNMYVTDALVRVAWTAVYEDGEQILVRNGCGAICAQRKAPDTFLRLDVTVELCTPDPRLHEMLLIGSKLLTGAGGGAGWAAPPLGAVETEGGVSIEVWTERVDNGDLDLNEPYGWWVLPKVTDLRPGDKALEAGAQASIITGRAFENAAWDDGPMNDWPDDSDRVVQWVPTDSLPDTDCDYQTVPPS